MRNSLLGFDNLFNDVFSQSVNYPPYDVVKADNNIVLRMALAGFDKEDINISLENNYLVVEGSKEDSIPIGDYFHKGISTKSFKRRFAVANGVDVKEAKLEQGLLEILLERPEYDQVKRIEVA